MIPLTQEEDHNTKLLGPSWLVLCDPRLPLNLCSTLLAPPQLDRMMRQLRSLSLLFHPKNCRLMTVYTELCIFPRVTHDHDQTAHLSGKVTGHRTTLFIYLYIYKQDWSLSRIWILLLRINIGDRTGELLFICDPRSLDDWSNAPPRNYWFTGEDVEIHSTPRLRLRRRRRPMKARRRTTANERWKRSSAAAQALEWLWWYTSVIYLQYVE